tara:strand:- start:262 stop:1119 length:858 start_codon:yes stop_codon:yes gene_type:complete
MHYLIQIFLFSFIFLFTSVSCNKFIPDQKDLIARVGSNYLYKDNLVKLLGNPVDYSDSLIKARSIIDNWARSQLLMQQAKINLPEGDLLGLESLVDNYRKNLYENTYRKAVINKNLDTLISDYEMQNFLSDNEELFKLRAPLFQVRYIHLPPDNVDQFEIQRSFQRFDAYDRKFLDSLSFQFYNFILSDSLWIDKSNLTSTVSFLDRKNFKKYIRKLKFFKIEDSLGVYLFYLRNYLEKGDIAPSQVVKTTIKNIILNRRKIEFIKKFEKDILHDAIKSKNFEVY